MYQRLGIFGAIIAVIFSFAITSVEARPKRVRVKVSKSGFSPSSIKTEKGSLLTLVFTRTSKEGCGSKVVFSSLGITKDLPVGKSITIKFTPDSTGSISFTCGMGMYKGQIIVQ